MTSLLFKDRGWDVLTSSWSVGAKTGKTVTLVYTWGGDGSGWSSNSVSTAQVALPITFAKLLERITAAGAICDLRDLT